MYSFHSTSSPVSKTGGRWTVVFWIVAGLSVVLEPACRQSALSPDLTLYGCETDPNCNNGGGGGGGGGGLATDPNPAAPGYWMGTTVTPATCISPNGAGISDVDADGTSDYCENLLADKFRPAMRFSQYDCDTGMEPYWAAKAFPAEGNVVRVGYLFSYYEDCGLPSPTPHDAEDGIITGGDLCGVAQVVGTLFTFNGLLPDYSLLGLPISPDDQCAGHAGDSEFLILDLRYCHRRSQIAQNRRVKLHTRDPRWGA